MHQRLAKDGLVVVTVALDDVNDNPKVKDAIVTFLRKQKAGGFVNVLLDEKDEFWQTKLRFDGPPHVYLFDRQGKWTSYDSQELTLKADQLDQLVETLVHEK